MNMNSKISRAFSFFIYIIGMGAFLLSDIVISKYYPLDDIALWAFLKSIMLLAASTVILGLDQVLLRRPETLMSIWRYMILRVLFLSFLVSFVVVLIKPVSIYFVFVLIVSLAFISLSYSIYRGALKMNRAQISLNGWKVIFFVSVCWSVASESIYNIEGVIIFSVLVSLLGVLVVAMHRKDWVSYYLVKSREGSIAPKELILKEAKYFFLQTVGLNLSVNFEQILLNFFGFTDSSANLFVHFSVFLPLVVFLNGFIGFYLGPYLREKKDSINITFFKKINLIFILIGLGLSLISYCFGSFAFDYFYSDKYELNNMLAALIVILGFLRLYYVIPSALIGVASSTKRLIQFSKFNIAALALSFLIFVFLVFLNVNPVISVMFSSITNWGVRVVTGLFISYQRVR
ncbi:hypothetical protein EEA47_10930 [Vibrio alginolyticus]|nr:hypothetical protein EEA47_10930 [Vibrio alginolyticus]